MRNSAITIMWNITWMANVGSQSRVLLILSGVATTIMHINKNMLEGKRRLIKHMWRMCGELNKNPMSIGKLRPIPEKPDLAFTEIKARDRARAR